MEQSAKLEKEEEECGICLDALANPVSLPCSHKFCSDCLNRWRSKYGIKSGEDQMDRKCPLCREKIPPSKEMISQLRFFQSRKSNHEARGDTFSEHYKEVKSIVERLEREVGDWTEIIDSPDDDKKCSVLPTDIFAAAKKNNIQKVLDWLGPLPVDKQRINSRNPEFMDITLVHCAVIYNNSELLSILLQLGADVDSVSAHGGTPLAGATTVPDFHAQARLLLEWGAELSNCPTVSKDEFVATALSKGNTELANLLKSEFGGRRCEIINLTKRQDLNGETCVVGKYLPDKERYEVVFETSKEAGLVGPENLKRRDRTPNDCGYYVTYKNGRFTRRDFSTKEECQAFVSSLTNDGDKSGVAEAEARAEQAAASLLAELEIDSSNSVGSKKKKGKQKKGTKKKGRK